METAIDESQNQYNIRNQLILDWSLERPKNHWYAESTDFAVRALGDGRGRSCLVIGSPIFEVRELRAAGWVVTYLDIRQPPVECGWVEGDATAMPFPAESFDAVSSSCVLCHAGTGRYGDQIAEGGDALMLAEIVRVLRPGSSAALTWGPMDETARMDGTWHRLYTLGAARALLPPGISEITHEVIAGGIHGYLAMHLRRI